MGAMPRKPTARNDKAAHTYTVILDAAEEGGYHAFCPALKGCHSEGETVEKALRNIRAAAELYLESLREHGEPIPSEDLVIKPMRVRA